jgi:ubiquinone/menaquinone biosynthesis C-methylase UbiE
MLRLARDNLRQGWLDNVETTPADAAALTIRDASFDLLCNAHLLDLNPFAQVPSILGKFHRVQAPGGRLVLLNTSKREQRQRTGHARAAATGAGDAGQAVTTTATASWSQPTGSASTT